MVKPNREYKNSLFKDLFHDETTALELYNALTGGNFTLRDGLRFTTLENALFMDRLNDISFTIGDRLVVLVEHQLCEASHKFTSKHVDIHRRSKF